MATLYWVGRAEAVAQVTQITPGGTIGEETFTLTVGGKTVSYTAQPGDTATAVAQALRDAWNDSTHPYFTGVTAAEQSGVLVLTADVAGTPFAVAASAGGAASLDAESTAASAGPNDWSTPDNWSTGSLPGNGDRAVIANCADAIIWGLDQSGITLAELIIEQSFTGVLGLPESSFALSADDVDATAVEYRKTCLRIGATTVRIGEHHGNGAPAGAARIKLDTLDAQTQLYIVNTAAGSADAHLEPLRWIGTHADNIVHITKGRLGIATTHAGEVATVATLNVGHRGNAAGDVAVHIGDGVTIDTVNQAGGVVAIGADLTTLNQTAGTITTYGDASLGTGNVGGTAYLNGAGNITTLRVRGGGVADFSRDPRPKTVTHCQLHRGAALNLRNGNPMSITLTNDIEFVQCEPADTVFTAGPDVRVALSSL